MRSTNDSRDKSVLVASQRIEDDLLGLIIEFYVVPDSDEPSRVVITQLHGEIVQEYRFDIDGKQTGSGTSIRDPRIPPNWRVLP
jgi:hypothetical protein